MLWSGDLGIEGVQESGKFSRKILEVGHGGELKLPRIYLERRNRNREIDG